jgi:hypothetical protein
MRNAIASQGALARLVRHKTVAFRTAIRSLAVQLHA